MGLGAGAGAVVVVGWLWEDELSLEAPEPEESLVSSAGVAQAATRRRAAKVPNNLSRIENSLLLRALAGRRRILPAIAPPDPTIQVSED
jgi:hypothetical protein